MLGYAELIEQAGLGDVESAALVYFQNGSKAYRDTPLDLATDAGFSVPFTIATEEIELDRKALKLLMKRFREIADMELPPKGLEGCKHCASIQHLLDAEVARRGQEEYARNRDGLARVTSRKLAADRELALRAWNESEDDIIIAPDLGLIDWVPGPTDL